MDDRLLELVRTARAAGDPDAIRRAVVACERAGQGAPADLVDQVTWPARSVESTLPLRIRVEDVAGASEQVGETPGRLQFGEHRHWYVCLLEKPEPAILKELSRVEAPGLHYAGPAKQAPAFAAHAAKLPALRRLSLSGGIDDDVLAGLGATPLLSDLVVDSLKLTTRGMALLCAPNLVRLSLQRTSKVKDLSSLGAMQLRRLSLRSLRVSGKLLGSLPVLPELTHLDLSENKISAKMLALLPERLPGLRELLVQPKQGEGTSFMEALAGFPKLEALTVHGPRLLASPGLAPLTALKRLRYLNLDVADVADLSVLPQLDSLRRLVAYRPDDETLRVVGSVRRLRELALIWPEPGTTAAGMAAVKQLTQLERLDLRGDRLASANALLGAVQGMCPASLRRLRFEEGWRNAAEILSRLDLPGVEVVQEKLLLPRPSSGWTLA